MAHILQSSLVRCGQYSFTTEPPSVLNWLTVALSLAVGFWIRSNNSAPLHCQSKSPEQTLPSGQSASVANCTSGNRVKKV